MMPKVLVTVLLMLGAFFPVCAAAVDAVQKVRIGYPSAAVSTLPFDIAKEKGFYSKAGLDVEYIQMRTAIAPQAILNGNINFFTSPQSGISAAVSGLPLIVVLVLYRDTPWVLVTSKEINQAQDLIGKKIASPISAHLLTISPGPALGSSAWTISKSPLRPPVEHQIALPL
jgi:ABC-type nitrate/sulfonate/bicarbonate transport system substrate-binding protein